MAETETRTVRHVRVRANGMDFHVALAGPDDAPLVLCLHGFPECWYSYRHQLEALSQDFLVAAPDLRGYGESDKPRSGYELRNLATDAAALVGALGRIRANLVGHDWGGLIAYATAAFFPGTIERLAVLNCPHPAAIPTGMRSLDQLRRSWYIFAIQIPKLFDLRLAQDSAAILPRIFMSGARRRAMLSAHDLDVFRRTFARAGAPEAALEYYRTNLSPLGLLLGRMRVPPVSVPTLVLHAQDDPFVGPAFFRGHEAHFTGPYEIRFIPGCGHWTQQEAPELVNEALSEFFGRRVVS